MFTESVNPKQPVLPHSALPAFIELLCEEGGILCHVDSLF
jgi:hypothetical protein